MRTPFVSHGWAGLGWRFLREPLTPVWRGEQSDWPVWTAHCQYYRKAGCIRHVVLFNNAPRFRSTSLGIPPDQDPLVRPEPD